MDNYNSLNGEVSSLQVVNNSSNVMTTGTQSSNSILQNQLGQLNWLAYQQGPTVAYTNYSTQIRKVENGYVLWNSSKEYVFNTMAKLTDFLNKEEGKK